MGTHETPRIVDVVVPVYRPGPWLGVCVDSILGSSDVDVRVCLVDDDPGERATRSVAAARPSVRTIELPRNRGFAAASNAGIRVGRAPYVLCLNQDARVESDYLVRLIGRLEVDPSLAAVGGKILHQPGPYGAPDGTLDSAGIEMRRGRRAVDIGQGEPDLGQFDGYREVFGVCAAAALYRRSALESAAEPTGVFDEQMFMHKEDVDLAWRLRIAGFRAAVDGSAVAYHARGTRRAADRRAGPMRPVWQFLDLLGQERRKPRWVRRLAVRNQVYLLLKNEEASDFVRSLPDLIAYQAIQTAISAALDPVGVAWTRAEMVRLLPSAIESRSARRGKPVGRRWLP